MKTPYQILGIESNASLDEVRHAYKKLAKQYHPDAGGSAEKLVIINQAYQEIINQKSQPKTVENFDFRNFFNSEFSFARKNRDIQIKCKITIDDVIDNNKKILNYNDKSIEISIPKGVKNNHKVMYKGFGENQYQTAPGNLYITFQIQDNEKYTTEEHDIYTKLNIDIFLLMVGTEQIVETPYGRQISLKIKPGTQVGTKLRIPNMGLPKNKTDFGDFYVVINSVIPALNAIDMEKTFKSFVPH